MSIETTSKRLESINNDSLIQNLIAQANARYILLNTAENKENFPPYTIKDQELDILGLYYLQLGCEYAENDDLESAREPLERGASILEYVHGAEFNKTELSNYYSLISALSYYVSFQYSKSFILINKTDSDTVIAKLIKYFLQRNFIQLEKEIQVLLVNITYYDNFIAENNDEIEGADKIYEITIARCLDRFVKYFQSGNTEFLETAKLELKLLKEIAEVKSEPGVWWVIRLLLLILEGFEAASLWSTLKNHFDVSNNLVKKYIQALVYNSPRGIYELFITQRKSLTKVLNNDKQGCIVTIPTSSGKTRIAEIAMLHCILNNSAHKVLYIAPFRSLAFEIENSLEKIFSRLNINVSHLYGGALYSKLDEMMIDDSNIIIATPEKAKAILRGNRELAETIKFVIVDEGHLLGPDKRLVVNEIFYEELRFFLEHNGGRFLLLSAVLPNAEDLAQWLTKSKETIYRDNWRPSDERLGVLEWNGKEVSLNWLSSDTERSSFNNKFIKIEQLPRVPYQKRPKFFPGDKNEAIAATTYKLRNFGPALIFVGIKASVFKMASAYLKCLGNNPEDYNWINKSDWKSYEMTCTEAYGQNNDWLLYARKGILCHHGGLNNDVRLPLERLMRNDKPLVIISTSTLGQGVNLGVSTVVFSTIYQSGSTITKRDFWNIAGRAGRAFVDHEAKILVAYDKSDTSTLKARNKNKWELNRILSYFDKKNIDRAYSGILSLVQKLREIANLGGVDFEFLLELIADNRIEEIGVEAKIEVDDILDWIDDTLLALQELHNSGTENYDWIQSFFSNSLAYIQITEESNISHDEFLNFLKARTIGIVKKVTDNGVNWKSVIDSGIPLNSNLFIEDKLLEIVKIIKGFDIDNLNVEDKVDLIDEILTSIRHIPILEENNALLLSDKLYEIIEAWISAEPLSEIRKIRYGEVTVSDMFSFKLPWLFNAISKKLRNIELDREATAIEELSVLIEIGLPDFITVKIYQSGIRSRVYSNELATKIWEDVSEISVARCRNRIVIKRNQYKELVSDECGEWIDMLFNLTRSKVTNVDAVANFNFNGENTSQTILIAKEINGKQYLLSPDYNFIHDDSGGNIDFSSVNNVPGIFFKYNSDDEVWVMSSENPYIRITE
jgi:replicative superfamily II helicase